MKKRINNRIKDALAEKGKSNRWLAEKLGKSSGSVSKWCANKIQPSPETLVEIAKILGIEVSELVIPPKV